MTQETFDPTPGKAEQLDDGLIRVLAPNPSPMTYRGTNTYLLGQDALAVIDPGPQDQNHLDAIMQAIGKRSVTHILVTHSHLDHSPLASSLAQETGAPILAFGDSATGRTPLMQALASKGLTGGGEGIDTGFVPDHCLADQELIQGHGWHLRALHTPGHMGNHLCFQWGDVIFSGDLVMGWASSLVSPPDGDLGQFLWSCDRLQACNARRLFPGHGAPVDTPATRINWLVEHRNTRSAAILEALSKTPASLEELTAKVYQDTPAEMHRIAARNLFAHLVHLSQSGQVVAHPEMAVDALFSR